MADVCHFKRFFGHKQQPDFSEILRVEQFFADFRCWNGYWLSTERIFLFS